MFSRYALVGLVALVASSTASATLLTSNINMDNGFQIYISTSDSVQGTLFGTGNNWPATITHSTTLTSGTDYYLHVRGYDQGGIAGFLGEFTLDSSDHQFANAAQNLLTNTTHWAGNTIGFNGNYNGTMTDLGLNGVGPWGFRGGVSASARWIWVNNANSNNVSYFTTKISASAVPEPGTIALLGLAMTGVMLVGLRKRARSA